ncbi:MAG: hypothetical protein CM1200mP1_09270 [Candidatus Neomarinimicrobiota bacterium]|nr:MAG: hypothetical protein CM1200mP1_09270 [Candidatus Neomarinimicrobiota bacterium]
MFAIVNISGKQYRVKNGAKIKVPNLNSEVGSKVEFDSVLFKFITKENSILVIHC